MKNLPISCWAAEDIPTNRAENYGYSALTETELLSIIIGSGSIHNNAVELSRIIMNQCGNTLSGLAKIPQHELLKIRGLGRTKLARIMAAMELGRRRKEEDVPIRPDLGTATRIYNHYFFLQDLEREEFWVSLMDKHYQLIKDVKISQGGLDMTPVDVRIIIREAVLANATIIAAVHNHPSGMIKPSSCDDNVTQEIKNACKLMHIHFQDHVIIGSGQYYSYHEMGKV